MVKVKFKGIFIKFCYSALNRRFLYKSVEKCLFFFWFLKIAKVMAILQNVVLFLRA